jgi:hypothetical protein
LAVSAVAGGVLPPVAPHTAVQDKFVGQPLARVRKTLDLRAAGLHPPATVALTPLAEAVLASTTVPVLVPDWAAFAGLWQVTAEADWYTLTATLDGVTWVVQGDRVATVDPELAPAGWQPPTWQTPYVSRNEAIPEATFLAFGASYSVSVECAEPERDIRCTGDAAVAQAVASLRRWAGQAAPTGGAR